MNRDIREVIREEPLVGRRLVDLLRVGGPLSVPELAAASGFPPDEVMVWVSGLRKYGHLTEVPAAASGGDPRYAAVERK